MNLISKAKYFEKRRVVFAVAAIVAFPLYYVFWHDIFPQPYENLTLRLLGSALFVPIVIDYFRPFHNRRAMTIYFYLALFYSLPFFFTLMLFKNDGAPIWIASVLAALFIMVILLDWIVVIGFSLIGPSAAWLCYIATTPYPHYHFVSADLAYLPVIAFVIAMGAIADNFYEAVSMEREETIRQTVTDMADRLRVTLMDTQQHLGRFHWDAPIQAIGTAEDDLTKEHARELAKALEHADGNLNYLIATLDALAEYVNRRR